MKKRTAFALLMMCSLGAWAEPWTLRDCIQHALQNNISIRKSRVNEESGEATLKQNKSVLWPSLSFSTNHGVSYRPGQDTDTYRTCTAFSREMLSTGKPRNCLKQHVIPLMYVLKTEADIQVGARHGL